MKHHILRIIQEVHSTLTAISKLLGKTIERGLQNDLPGYFEMVNAMLFYIVEPNGRYPRDPMYDHLFMRIVMQAPAPIGLGED